MCTSLLLLLCRGTTGEKQTLSLLLLNVCDFLLSPSCIPLSISLASPSLDFPSPPSVYFFHLPLLCSISPSPSISSLTFVPLSLPFSTLYLYPNFTSLSLSLPQLLQEENHLIQRTMYVPYSHIHYNIVRTIL